MPITGTSTSAIVALVFTFYVVFYFFQFYLFSARGALVLVPNMGISAHITRKMPPNTKKNQKS